MQSKELIVKEGSANLMMDLEKRYQRAKGVADQWSSLLEAAFHFAVPFRNRFYQPKEFQGDMKNARLYDTTAVDATKTFVSDLHDSMTPPQVQWGFLELDEEWMDPELYDEKDREEAQQALNRYMRILFSYIHQSNFDVVINECYYDLSVGTSGLVINQYTDEQPLLYSSIPIDRLCIEESLDGKVETWFRTWESIKISELTSRWKKAKIPTELQQMFASDPNATVDRVKEGVAYYPQNDKSKKFLYAVWHNHNFLFYEWLDSNPGIIWRFQKTNNETWGRGPVMEALPSIISLNEMARIELAAANLNTFKPYMAFSDSVFNPYTFKLEPFTVIPIAPLGSDGQFPLIPLPDSSNPQFSQMTIQDLRYQIKRLLFATADATPSIQPQSVTEVLLRQQELAKKIGPLFSRLQHEFLWPVIKRSAYILDKMGLLKMPTFNERVVSFKYKSPLALTKGQEAVARVTSFMQILQGFLGPEMAKLYINVQQMPYLIAESLQIDERYLNSADDVAEAVKKMVEASNAQNQAAAEQEGQG